MPNSVGENQAKRKLAAGEPVLCMGVNQMHPPACAKIYEATANTARAHRKSMGVGAIREHFEFQIWLMQLGMSCLTGGSDVGYILTAGRADVRRQREVQLS